MTDARPAILISDACVLIDYANAECCEVFRLVSESLFPIHVPQDVFGEVAQLSDEDAMKFGITVFSATFEQLQEASVRGGASRSDKLCFAAARDSGGAVWSNDVQLRKLCSRHGVAVFWGLEILLELKKIGVLAAGQAQKYARKVQSQNPTHIKPDVLELFERKLEELEKNQKRL